MGAVTATVVSSASNATAANAAANARYLTTASADAFGIAFSAATAGKTWSEIQTITANTKAGQGTLGAAYAALTPAEKMAFHFSATQSYAAGGASATYAPAVVPAVTATVVSSASNATAANATANARYLTS